MDRDLRRMLERMEHKIDISLRLQGVAVSDMEEILANKEDETKIDKLLKKLDKSSNKLQESTDANT